MGSAFWTSSALGIASTQILFYWVLRPGPGPTEVTPSTAPPANWIPEDVCPASCPAPSLAFCLEPVVDALQAQVEVYAAGVEELLGRFPLLAVVGLCSLVSGLVGIFAGRRLAPAPSPFRVNGRRYRADGRGGPHAALGLGR